MAIQCYMPVMYIYIHTVFCWGEKEPKSAKSAKGDFHIAMTNGPCVDDINDVPICPYLKSSWVPVRTQFWIPLGAISLILSHIPYHSMSYPNFWYGWRAGYITYIYIHTYTSDLSVKYAWYLPIEKPLSDPLSAPGRRDACPTWRGAWKIRHFSYVILA